MQKSATTEWSITDNTAAYDAARTQLLQYLQLLELPEADTGQLADQALATAQTAQPTLLLPAAIAALHDLLRQRLDQQVAAMPPLQRQPMLPEPLDRSLPQFLRDDICIPLAKAAQNLLLLLQRRFRLLSICIAVVVAAGYQQIG